MTEPDRSLLDHRLIVVTGKGGVGKTAIACALAEAARRSGRNVLLAETAPIEAVAAHFERSAGPLGYAGRVLRPRLRALRVDPHEALADYVRVQFGLGALTDRVLQSEVFQHLLEAAPGWRELIVLGKVWHLEQKRERDDRPSYDLLIVDAPATGHGLTFLDVPRVVQQAVRAGPLARHASWVEALMHDRERTLLLPVTLPEELPVLETIELVQRARDEIDVAVDRIVVNRMPRHPVDRLAPALAGLPERLAFESLPGVPVIRELLGHAARRDALARSQRARVSSACRLPVVDFPDLEEGFTAEGDWPEYAERILAEPVWPEDADCQGASAA